MRQSVCSTTKSSARRVTSNTSLAFCSSSVPRWPFMPWSPSPLLVCSTQHTAQSAPAESLMSSPIRAVLWPTSLKSASRSATPSMNTAAGLARSTVRRMKGSRSAMGMARRQ